MALAKFQKGDNTNLTKDFKKSEFECHCSKKHENQIETELVFKLQKLRDEIGKPIHINSGFRCEYHNRTMKPKGDPKSKHLLGVAADIRVNGMDPRILAIKAARYDLRVGIYKRFIHVDLCLDTNEDFIGGY